MKFHGKIETDGNDTAADIGGEIYNTVKDLTTQTVRIMQQHDDYCPPNHLYICLSAAAGALAVAAKLMSVPEDIEGEELARWADLPASREAILAAALLVARCTVPVPDGTIIEYSPPNIKATLEALTKVTGNPDYSMLAPGLVNTTTKLPPTGHFFENTNSVKNKAGMNPLN